MKKLLLSTLLRLHANPAVQAGNGEAALVGAATDIYRKVISRPDLPISNQ